MFYAFHILYLIHFKASSFFLYLKNVLKTAIMPFKKKPFLIPCWERHYKIKNENSGTTGDRDKRGSGVRTISTMMDVKNQEPTVCTHDLLGCSLLPLNLMTSFMTWKFHFFSVSNPVNKQQQIIIAGTTTFQLPT
jgi:hypothetical protein